MRFLRSPARIETDEAGNVTGLVCEKTKLVERPGASRMGVERLGEFETIPCDTFVFAIGDSIEPGIGLPLDPEWSGAFATVPEPWADEPERDRYMVWDPASEAPVYDMFVVGWARKASDGLVGKARADAVQGCDEVLAYLDGRFEKTPGEPASELGARLNALLHERGISWVDWPSVKKLYEHEATLADEHDVEEYKITNRSQMLEICNG
jgi:ferredoxin--NADP+ reductase